VYLVVRSLVEGLYNDDRMIDLQRRVREFPEDLEDYFRHILISLDPIYREQTARAFQVSLCATRPLSPTNYWFLDLDEEDMNFAAKMEVKPLSEGEVHLIRRKMKRRLNGRCKGLLEVTTVKNLDLPFRYQVDFLHRTVRDFLLTGDMQELLKDWTALNFDVNLTICRTILAEIKSLQINLDYFNHPGPLSDLVDEFMSHARGVEIKTKNSPIDLLDALGAVLKHHVKQLSAEELKAGLSYPWDCWVKGGNLEVRYKSSLLTFAMEKSLFLYVQRKVLQKVDLIKNKQGRPLLDYALRPEAPFPSSTDCKPPDLEMVALLLANGANPNEVWIDTTVWEAYLASWSKNLTCWPYNARYESIKMLILHGADRDVKVEVYDDCSDLSSLSLGHTEAVVDAEDVIDDKAERRKPIKIVQAREVFSQVFSPDDVAELQNIMCSKSQFSLMSWLGWRQVEKGSKCSGS
jgi:hypothetical protein